MSALQAKILKMCIYTSARQSLTINFPLGLVARQNSSGKLGQTLSAGHYIVKVQLVNSA